MINLNANTKPLEGYIGAVDGILEAIKRPDFQGNFGTHVLRSLKKHFLYDTIAAKEVGDPRIQHVFEWGEREGETSSIPLFKLNIVGAKDHKVMSYVFLPSTVQVPLPNPERYGFDKSRLQYLSRHTFRLKALVMETQSLVEIAPKPGKRLFIPSETSDKGFVYSSKPVHINPGGNQATGGFAEWWALWFGGAANSHILEQTKLAEEIIAKTGQRVIRDATTKQFARGSKVSMGYVNATKRNAELKMKAELERVYGDDENYEGDE